MSVLTETPFPERLNLLPRVTCPNLLPCVCRKECLRNNACNRLQPAQVSLDAKHGGDRWKR